MTTRKTAFITGSTSGIGLAIAETLAAEQYNIVLNGFGEPQQIEELRAGMESRHGVSVLYTPADMSRAEQISEAFELIQDRFSSLEVLVNNAGIQHVAPIEEFPPERWEKILAINLSAGFHTTRLAVPTMKQNGFGRIVNIASAHALVASPFKSAYVAAKHGVLGLTRTVALEVAEFGITCNAVCPGYVQTPLVEGQIDDTAAARGISREEVIRDVLLAAQPTREFVQPADLARLVAFLCSDSAAAINGAALPIDGGWTAQ